MIRYQILNYSYKISVQIVKSVHSGRKRNDTFKCCEELFVSEYLVLVLRARIRWKLFQINFN